MRIIDARSGRDHLKVGEVVDYGEPPPFITWVDSEAYTEPDGTPGIRITGRRKIPNPDTHREWWRLLDVRDRFFNADALIEYHGSDGSVQTRWGPLAVRFTHPSFRWQRVAFVPT